jgi:hypothetical protein
MADPTALPVLTQMIVSVTVMLHTFTPTVTQVLPDDAKRLLPCLRRYRTELERQLGGIPPRVALENDMRDTMGLGGMGSQYFCILDLERAFETSITAQKPVTVSFD